MSENGELPLNCENDRLSIGELKVKAKETHELWKDKYYQEEPLRKILELNVNEEYPYPVEIKKSNLNPNKKYPISFNPDHIIEIKIEKIEKGDSIWAIRNKTLAENPKDPSNLDGNFKKGNTEDIARFISEVNSKEIGIHKLISILQEMKNPERKSIYKYTTKEGEIFGVVLIEKEENSRSAYIKILATNPKFQNMGVGRNILNGLKNRFDYLRVAAVPFGLTPESTNKRLSNFYQQNGFVADGWSKKIPSLDDVDQAKNWQVMDENVYSIGNGQHTLEKTFIVRTVFQEMLKQEKIKNTLSPELVKKLKVWNKINEEKNRIEAESDNLHKLIDIKSYYL